MRAASARAALVGMAVGCLAGCDAGRSTASVVDFAVSADAGGRIEFTARTIALPGYNFALSPGDYNSDWRVDLALLTESAHGAPTRAGVLLGDGAGGFSAPAKVEDAGLDAAYALASDLDGDHRLDLAVSLRAARMVRVLPGLGDGRFAAARDLPVSGTPDGLAAADLDGDGAVDLVVADHASGIGLLPGRGSATLYSFDSRFGIATGDFDGDGRTDIAIPYEDGIAVLMNTPRRFTIPVPTK